MAFQTYLNLIDDAGAYYPRKADTDLTRPVGYQNVWRTFPRQAEIVAAVKAEADGAAVWARWAPGLPHNEANLQVDKDLAAVAGWGTIESGGGGVPFENVSLLMHCDGANGGTVFTDSSSFAHTVSAVGPCVTTTAEKKYGTASLVLTSENSWTVPNGAEFNVTTGDFTIEGWGFVTPGVIGLLAEVMWAKGSAPYPFRIFISTGSKLTANGQDADSNTVFSIVDTVNFPTNTWVHVALTREGNNFRLFKNGVQVASTVVSATALAVNTTAVRIGDLSTTPWFGNLDELRFIKGTAAYTADFDVPTEAFPDA